MSTLDLTPPLTYQSNMRKIEPAKRPQGDDEPPKASRRALTRDDWITAAIDRLVSRSIDAVLVDPLAKEMGVTRGSFYWHFKSRDDLLQAMLGRWREMQTRRIVERLSRDRKVAASDQIAQIRHLPSTTRKAVEGASLELAIRAWARRDKMARDVLEAVDRERIEFTRGLLVEIGTDQATAQTMAIFGYAYTVGEAMIRSAMTEEQIATCRDLLTKLQLDSASDKLTP